eukprot:1158170-Pelagomonas_calceolata.AAC.6
MLLHQVSLEWQHRKNKSGDVHAGGAVQVTLSWQGRQVLVDLLGTAKPAAPSKEKADMSCCM